MKTNLEGPGASGSVCGHDKKPAACKKIYLCPGSILNNNLRDNKGGVLRAAARRLEKKRMNAIIINVWPL